ncbi:MAG TPA: hypothetical protein VNK05_17450 [Chloroflexota bacterium]|nr:hypothetical protein [Chloroflexota bacterium]
MSRQAWATGIAVASTVVVAVAVVLLLLAVRTLDRDDEPAPRAGGWTRRRAARSPSRSTASACAPGAR